MATFGGLGFLGCQRLDILLGFPIGPCPRADFGQGVLSGLLSDENLRRRHLSNDTRPLGRAFPLQCLGGGEDSSADIDGREIQTAHGGQERGRCAQLQMEFNCTVRTEASASCHQSLVVGVVRLKDVRVVVMELMD